MLIHAERCSGNRTVRPKAHPSDVGERRIPGGSLTCSFAFLKLSKFDIGRVSAGRSRNGVCESREFEIATGKISLLARRS